MSSYKINFSESEESMNGNFPTKKRRGKKTTLWTEEKKQMLEKAWEKYANDYENGIK